jgi:dTDP-4-dehydrorhamnose 3,5-epimerase-like enzyme
VVSGLVTIVVFDGRRDSPTSGRVNEFTLSEKDPGLLIIPPNLYHGWKNIGTSEAIIINMRITMRHPTRSTCPGCGSCRPHNTLSLVSPARRNVGADDTTASRSNNRLICLDRQQKQSHGLAQAERKASKANRLGTTTRPPPNTV